MAADTQDKKAHLRPNFAPALPLSEGTATSRPTGAFGSKRPMPVRQLHWRADANSELLGDLLLG